MGESHTSASTRAHASAPAHESPTRHEAWCPADTDPSPSIELPPHRPPPAAATDPARQAWAQRLADPTLIPAHEFDPPPTVTEKILSDVTGDDATLPDIAAKAHTTLESLTLWLSRPDIAARLDNLESAIRRRVRLVALNSANSVLITCSTIMERFSRSPDRGPANYNDPKTHAIHTRNAANALMAARIHLYTLKLLTDPASPAPAREVPEARRGRRGSAPVADPVPAPTPGSASGPNPNRNPNPNLPTPTPTPTPSLPSPSRLRLFPNFADLDPTIDDQRAAPAPNPARDNAIRTPAATSGVRGQQGIHDAAASPTRTDDPPKNLSRKREVLSPTPATSTTTSPRACHTNPTSPNPRHPRSSAAQSPAASPATILTIAGAPISRARDPTSSRR